MRWIEEGVDHGALGHGAPGAGGGHLFQDTPDRPEICDLPPDLVQMMDGDALDLGAGVSAAVDQLQECPDLVQRKAELASPANEAQTSPLAVPVQPVAALATGGGGEQADALVVADRFDVAPGLLR